MNQKNILIGAAVVVVVAILAIGGYAVYNKSYQTNSSSNSGNQATVTPVNNAVLKTATNASVGQYLTDPSGKALYTYSSDSSGVSNCTGSCLATWPAYQNTGSMAGLPANVGTLMRTDNHQMQFTYKGLPLYYFAQDSNGQVTGDGVGGFYVAKP